MMRDEKEEMRAILSKEEECVDTKQPYDALTLLRI